MKPLERILLQRMEEQAEAEAARWRAESLAAAAGRPLCPCGRVIAQRAGTLCGPCAAKERDKGRKRNGRRGVVRLCDCGTRIVAPGQDTCAKCRARDALPRMGHVAESIVALASRGAIRWQDVAAMRPDTTEVTARVHLSRLVKRGRLVRVEFGLYRAVRT